MILFYSTYCPHCSMLIDTIQRNNKTDQVKLVCIEVLRARGQQIPVTSVPTLITLPEKRVYTGKAVFDYLLLPGRGKLLTAISTPNQAQAQAQTQAQTSQQQAPNDPMAFSMTGGSFADSYTDINHVGSTLDNGGGDTNYVSSWTTITEQEKTELSISNFTPEETRNKKANIDMDAYKMKRDMDLQSGDSLPPPTMGHSVPTSSRGI